MSAREGGAALTVREDLLDYPTAWAIQEDRGTTLEHHPRCSSTPGWDPISGPSFLCDCGALTAEWGRMCREQQAARASGAAGEV